ncbi:hypothetical protein MKW98_000391 [Papaver atlanticum]|uniref:Snakin-2 n=1 Tax=Papaver atlanticum TaxID=357466 RepID=A0AAD4S533_9MAGN|nr:hypothetical protein MKW98_000391 [Papaver atlanticum]
MAMSKALLASLVLSLLLLNLVEVFAADQMATGRSLKGIDCGAACKVRCSLSSRPNLCKRACGTCCARCSCVPSGTSGNHDECACYAAQTTHGGKKKCP